MSDSRSTSEALCAPDADEARPPADEEQRRRTRIERTKNLFVEAGAGTGKTRALVDRVEALVLDDGVPMETIAMITFTEKAATELRDRIRQRFEQSDHARASAAIEQLDGAAVSTLHSFAARILTEHPVEAGLPPGIEVLDEISSQVEFEHQWQQFLNEFLEDRSVARSLLSLEAAGVRIDHLRALALQLSDNWDLVEERLDLAPPQPEPIDASGLLSSFDEVLELRRFCTSQSDKLLEHLDRVARNRDELSNAFDHIEALFLAADMGREKSGASRAVKPGTVGKAANWQIDVALVRRAVKELGEQCDGAVRKVTSASLDYVGARIGRFVLATVEERRRSGCLQFHDLLVQVRQLLRDKDVGGEVRASLHQKYTHLLLDEFQDTDPIQIEIAVLIATTDSEVEGREWNDLEVAPGRLFLVGDPKQSIYRFRRADIGLYLAARERFSDRAALTVNFRTVEPIIAWINDVFSKLIIAEPQSQPEYVALSPHRLGADTVGPAVAILGAEPIEDDIRADDLRAEESQDVAATLAEVLGGAKPWQIEDPDEGWRAARPSDVCILLPTRISLASLERALDANGIPYRAETSSLVYATREVRELMLTLRAVSDPTDELAVVAALRSSVYGCGDDDLASWRLKHNGRFSLLKPIRESQDHPVAEAISHLVKLHNERHWLTPAGLLERVVRERAVLESAVATGSPRDVWRRLRFVVDQARAWSEAGGTDLRAYLEWTRRQGVDNARVSETVLPETDDDSVRIMTIHGAKGLEFPITVMAGLTTMFTNPQRGPSVSFPPGQPALLKVSSRVASERYDDWKPFNDTMDQHERLRLLYVAATRARDHLIVCLHRATGRRTTNASVLADHALNSESATRFVPEHAGTTPLERAFRQPLLDKGQWAAQRSEATLNSSRRTVVSATRLAREVTEAADLDPGLNKHPRNLDLPPWLKGRYGSGFGRAVHGVLQVVDLATGDGLREAAAAQAAAEGVNSQRSAVERVARSAIGSQAARQASRTECWREVWVAATVGDCLVEGYIDLLYRHGSGLVVVDWKTDRVDDDDDIAVKLDRYRLQGAGYVAALEAATALTVERMVFVFLREDGAIERELPSLRSAVAEVQQRTQELAELSGLNAQHPDL
ncbi:MAG: UvrD-helicase domain-containing protein [Acidimicrobiaceae bacterium]|nr:UvrD-helicase domain-containing protein [Acidimicrobiaceae bacterium]